MNVRKHGMQVAAAGIGLLWATVGQGDGLKLKNVEVVGSGASARVVLDVDGPVVYRAFTLPDPERVVIDLVGAVNGVRTGSQSFESGPVARLRVSQFQSAPQPVTRVVADLRTKVPFQVEAQDEDLVVVLGENPTVDAAAAPAGATPADSSTAATVVPLAQEPPVSAVPAGDSTATPVAVVPVTPLGEVATSMVALPSSDASGGEPVDVDVASRPDAGVETPEAGVVGEDTSPDAPPGGVELKPTGSDKRINLDVQAADIHTVLRTLAEYAGRNIIASKEVEGEVTVRLYDTPWEDALGSILKAHGYSYVDEHGIIRVGVLQKLRNEELEEAAADRKREDLLPIETQVVRLQFASAQELKPSLSDMLSGRGKLQVDERTNALIVSDVPGYVAKVTAMAADLDSRTPQVEIVTKLVDVGVDDSKNLGIEWSAKNIQPSGSPVSLGVGVVAPSTGAVGALRIGTVQSWGQLEATIDALAKNRKANVVSNPNITTVNNREARILVGQKIPLIIADQAGNAITQLQKIGIQMAVTPHVNSDKTITLDMHTEVSELSSQATVQGGVIIQTSEADTRVLVESGDTAIIGGLVRDVQSRVKTGIPVLQDIPLLGWFFRNTNIENAKRDLMIFVTPQLIEPGQKRITPGSKG